MVASRRLALAALSFRLRRDCVPLASFTKQQKISFHHPDLLRVILISFLISTLAMFDEIAQDEEDAEDYDMEALEHRTAAMHDDDDASTLVGIRGPGSMMAEEVVFEIGDEDGHDGSDDEDPSSAKRRRAKELEHDDGDDHEREGLMH